MSKYRWKIVIPDLLAPSIDVEQETFGKKALITALNTTKEEDILPYVADADALLVWHEIDITPRSMSKMKKCKVIVRVGTGYDRVDIDYASKKNILVCNVPDYGVNDVADHTLALMLSLYRDLGYFFERARSDAKNWNWQGARSKRLTGEMLGIVGLGRIGTAVAMRAKNFGLNVSFFDPYVSRGIEKSLGVHRKETLSELAAESDIISFHVPLTRETAGMAGKTFFSSLKRGAILVNTARGSIINLGDLYEALKKGWVSAAGMDVLAVEPPDEEDPLIRAWKDNEPWLRHRLLITPHCAFYSEDALTEMRKKAALEVKRVLEGEEPFNCVNLQRKGKNAQK